MSEPYVWHEGEGRTFQWAGYTNIIKAGQAETDGRLFFMETVGRQGEEPPDHVHEDEEEIFFILDGEVSFRCGEHVLEAGRNSFVFLPRQIPHGYTINSPEAHMLILTTPSHFGDRIEAQGRRID